MSWQRISAVLCVALALAGCQSAPKGVATKQYAVRGRVVSVDPALGKADVNTDDIPGFMMAMTMTYKVVDPAALGEMHPGDVISATLLTDEDAAGATNLRLKNIVILAQAKADYLPKVQYHVPAAGEDVPDFKLLNQSGKTIGLKSFHGKVLVMTFIYTRCPLADYCPRMSRNFAEIDKTLQQDPALYAKTHLLSVSFDPTYDTPKVLKSYGAAYTGKYAQETFGHWDFAAPPVAELTRMEQYFDVGVTPGEKGSLQHSLSTVVIGKDGKVVAFYPTNDWTVADVLAKVKAAS
jgi:protein SCO1/2